MPDVRIQSRYDRDTSPGIEFHSPTLTQQHFKEECDINKLMQRYSVTGTLPQFAGGFYDDLPDVTDFHSLQLYLMSAEDSFMTLPSAVRKRFDNDPGQLLDFLQDESNVDEAVLLGLLPPKEIVSPDLPLKKDEENQTLGE